MGVLNVYMCTWCPQKSNTLELKSWMVVSHQAGDGIQTQGFCKRNKLSEPLRHYSSG